MSSPSPSPYLSGFRFKSSIEGRKALLDDLAALVSELDDPANDPEGVRDSAEAVYEFIETLAADYVVSYHPLAAYENQPFAVVVAGECQVGDPVSQHTAALVCSPFFHTCLGDFDQSAKWMVDCKKWIDDHTIDEVPYDEEEEEMVMDAAEIAELAEVLDSLGGADDEDGLSFSFVELG